MRTRIAVLAAVVCGLFAVAIPATASAHPHHNKGLTIAALPNPIISGDGVTIYGRLLGPDNVGQTIYLYHRIAGAPGFTIIQKTTTTTGGEYEFLRADGIVTTNRSWFVRGPNGTHSRTIHEYVAALVTLSSTSASTTTGQPVILSGTVSPLHQGEPVRIQEQDSLAGNGWRTIAVTRTNAASAFSVVKRWGIAGDYTLRAVFPRDPRNITGVSDEVAVAVQQTQNPTFTINTSNPIIADGSPVTISGVLYKAGSSTTPYATPTEVTLYGKTAADPTFEALATTATGTGGAYSFVQTPDHNTVYKVETTLLPKRVTANLYEGVQDVVTLSSNSPTANVGGTVTLSGGVTPDHTGHLIYLQQETANGDWQNVAQGVVTTGSRFSFSYTFGQAGTFNLRARIYGGPENVGGASAPVTITVSGVVPFSQLPTAS
jgi:hypothetical protein